MSFLLLAAIFFRTNTASVYAFLGNYYYKHNNVVKAQNFYEKSFSAGNQDADLREVYVNSIINSPLTIEAQEKLVNIAEGKPVDSASVKAKYFLYDLRREIHRNYPLNYIKQAPYNQKIVRWNKFPITYSYKNPQAAPEEFVKSINKAFLEWEREGDLKFEETKDAHSNIIIQFEEGKQEELEYGRKYVISYTTPIINVNTLDSMVIKFFTHTPEGDLFTPNQVYNTALHEIFHALGFMGHSYDKANIMYLARESAAEDTKTTLTEADISTLKLLYKIKPDITNKGNLKSEYVPYLILGDDEDVSSAKIREAKHYIRKAPMLSGGYVDLAEGYVAQKNYASAIKCLEKALSLADTDDMKYIIYYNLAISYFYIGHTELPLDYVKKAMEIKETEELHYILAEIYSKKQDKKNAIKEYEYLIQKSPKNIDYSINLANIYLKSKDYISARKVLKTYLNSNPNEKNNPKLSAYKMLLF